jgi:small subunit ribosomal protein S18
MDKKEKTKNTVNEYIDYKDVVRLRAYMNTHARMMGKNRTGMTSHEQRRFGEAVKRARFMALLPYVSQ